MNLCVYVVVFLIVIILCLGFVSDAKKIKKRKPKPKPKPANANANLNVDSKGLNRGTASKPSRKYAPKDCNPPCRPCASWENSCFLPEKWDVASANQAGIYVWQNPKTKYTIFQNISYLDDPQPYAPRGVSLIGSPIEEYWITELMFRSLKLSLDFEDDILFRNKSLMDLGEFAYHGLGDQVYGKEIRQKWQRAFDEFESEKESLLVTLRDLSRHDSCRIDVRRSQLSRGDILIEEEGKGEVEATGTSSCSSHSADEIALSLFNSPSRRIAMQALQHDRFGIMAVRLYDVVFKAYQAALTPVQQQFVDKFNLNLANASETDRCAVVLDNREHYSLILSIRHTMHVLGPGWSLVVFHTAENEAYLRHHLQGYSNIEYRKIRSLSWAQASALKGSQAFYNAMPASCRHVMIFEDDAILRDGSRMPEYLAYAHAGAPWRWCVEQWCRYGGNGGASLRRKDVMLDVIQEIQCTDFACEAVDLYRETEVTVGERFNQEDQYLAKRLFSRRASYNDVMPTYDKQLEFSVETLYHENPVWLHKPWPYLHPINVIELMAKSFTYYDI